MHPTNVLLAMARSGDPKPGRWILPIIVIGMIGFTYFFVQTLEASDEPGTATTTSTVPATTTTTGGTPGATTAPTTTLAAGTEEYVQLVLDKQTEADDLALELIRANDAWENRETTGVGFPETEAAFIQLQQDTIAFAEMVRTMPGPPAGFPAAAEAHAGMITAAGKMETASQDILDGLRAPDDGTLRRAAVEDYLEAVDEFNAAAEAAIAGVGG